MKFRHLDINKSNISFDGKDNKPFRFYCYHIAEMFMELLPLIEINNSSKIAIVFGKKDKFDTEFDGIDGVTSVFVENFDFNYFYNSNKEEQNHIILENIKNTLVEIYKRRGKDVSVIKMIEETANKLIECNFNLKIPIKRLSKSSKDRKYKINVYRVLNNEIGEGGLCEVYNKSENKTYETWLTNNPSFVDIKELFRKVSIDDELFTIFTRFDKIVSQIEYREIVNNIPNVIVKYFEKLG